jgi:predicted transcriptional regulator
MVTTIDIRDELYERAKVLALREMVSLKWIFNRALASYLKAQEKRLKK